MIQQLQVLTTKPKFQMFEQVTVINGDRPQQGWIVGVEYYDPLAHVAATYNGQEPMRVKDVEGRSTDGSWEYVVSFQIGLDWAQIGDAEVQGTMMVSECCLSPVLPCVNVAEGKRLAA